MKVFYSVLSIILVAILPIKFTAAQTDNAPVKIAVFAPLYLNDAFTGSTYKLGKSNIPKNILPGLEFYNGVMLAIDSLNREGFKAEVNIYDSKQDASALNTLFNSTELLNTRLIIAALNTPAELKTFGDQAQKKSIPLISATYPNYVGITQNPYFILLNSSFNTHLEGLYKYMQRNHSLDQVIGIKRAGATEDYIKNTLTELNKSTPALPLKIKWIDVKDDVSANDLKNHLDSTKKNVVFVASPLESFGVKVVKALGANNSYNVTAIGMPTWDAIKEFNRRENGNVELVYSSPYNYGRNEQLANNIVRIYKTKYSSRPSDMVYKGYESVYHFTHLLAKHQDKFLFNLSDKDFTAFNQFDILPVKVSKAAGDIDFMENKKLYFVKKREGNVLSIY